MNDPKATGGGRATESDTEQTMIRGQKDFYGNDGPPERPEASSRADRVMGRFRRRSESRPGSQHGAPASGAAGAPGASEGAAGAATGSAGGNAGAPGSAGQGTPAGQPARQPGQTQPPQAQSSQPRADQGHAGEPTQRAAAQRAGDPTQRAGGQSQRAGDRTQGSTQPGQPGQPAQPARAAGPVNEGSQAKATSGQAPAQGGRASGPSSASGAGAPGRADVQGGTAAAGRGAERAAAPGSTESGQGQRPGQSKASDGAQGAAGTRQTFREPGAGDKAGAAAAGAAGAAGAGAGRSGDRRESTPNRAASPVSAQPGAGAGATGAAATGGAKGERAAHSKDTTAAQAAAGEESKQENRRTGRIAGAAGAVGAGAGSLASRFRGRRHEETAEGAETGMAERTAEQPRTDTGAAAEAVPAPSRTERVEHGDRTERYEGERASALPGDDVREDESRRRAGAARRTRKARLRLSKIDPASVMKTALLFSVAAGVVLWVAVGAIWGVIGATGLFNEVNKMVGDVVQTPGDTTPFKIQDYITTSKVMGVAALIAVLDVVLFTALATLGAFLYNLASAMIGGLEVTLAED